MADNPADETILDGDVDDHEYTLDNEKEDALLADFEFEIYEKDPYSRKLLSQKSRDAKFTEQNKNDVILNAHVNTIETTLQIGKLEDDYDIATDTDVTTCADIHSVSLNKIENEVINDNAVESQLATNPDDHSDEVIVNTLVQNRLRSPTNDDERILMNDDEDEVAEEAADEKVSDDEEEHDKDERDRFKTERSTMLSIGKSGRTWDNLPDSLDDVIVPKSDVDLLSQFTRNKKSKHQSQIQRKNQRTDHHKDVSSSISGGGDNAHNHNDVSSFDSPQRVSVIIQDRTPKPSKKPLIPTLSSSSYIPVQEGEWGVIDGAEGSIQYASDVGLFNNISQHREDYHSNIPHQPLPPSMQHLQQQVQPHQQLVQWQVQQQSAPRPLLPRIHPPHHLMPAMHLPQQLPIRHETLQPHIRHEILQPPIRHDTLQPHQIQIPQQQMPLPMRAQSPRIQFPAPPQMQPSNHHPGPLLAHPPLQHQPQPYIGPPQRLPRPLIMPSPQRAAPPGVPCQEMPPRGVQHHVQRPEHFLNQVPQLTPRPQLIMMNNARPPPVSQFPVQPPVRPQQQIIQRPVQPNTPLMPGPHPINSPHPPQQHLMHPPRGSNFPPPPPQQQMLRHPQHPPLMRPTMQPQTPGMLQQHPVFPDQQNTYINHGQFPPPNHVGHQFPPLLHPNEPPPPGENDSVQMFQTNTTMINNQHVPTLMYGMRRENPYGEHQVNRNASASNYNNTTTRARDNSSSSYGQKRYSEDNVSSVKRIRYESHNSSRKADSPSWKSSQSNTNLIPLKHHRPALSTNANPQDNASAISRLVHQVHPGEKKKIVIPSSANKTMPTTTSVVANKSTTLRNIVTVSSSWKQQTVVRSSGGVISPAVTTTSQSSNSNVQNIARISVAGATANASSSGITNNTNIPQEVHQVFRLKTKGGKIMYKSVPVDPKTLQYKTQTTDGAAGGDNAAGDSNQNPRRLVVSNISNLPNAQQGVVIKENSAVEYEKIRQAAASVSIKYSKMSLGERFSQIKPLVCEDGDENGQSQQQISPARDMNLNSKNLGRLVVVANSSSRVVNSTEKQSCKVIVKNIAASTKSQQISRVASTCGKIKKITWNAVSPSQNEAEIIFSKAEEAILFCTKYNRKMIDLSLITVSIVKE